MSEKHYKAFISYSHKDEEFGNWLHKQLENYKIPKQLKEDYPYLPKKLFPIFRDIYELSAGDDLKIEIGKALKNSEALIILCSPKSAKSIWVNKEIIDFKKLHKDAKIIPIIIEGIPFAKESDKFDDELECFPDALKYEIDSDGNLTDKEIEIVASNAINKNEGKELAKLKLISGLLGVPFSDLYRRDKEQEKKTRRIQWSIGSLVFLMMLGLTIFSFMQRNRAIESEQIALKEKVRAEENKREAEKQLIIATNKTQSLSILTKKTLESLMLTDEKILVRYLQSVLNSGEREIFIEMLRPLIKETESMDNEERQYWFDILPVMTKQQVSKLVKILMVEGQKLYKLELKYQKEIKKLNEKHLKQWKEFQRKKCFKDNKKEICLSAINELLDSSLEKNNSIMDYFKHYNKLEKNPSAYYYHLYGKFLKKRNKKKEVLTYLNKAISIDSNNSDYIKELAIYYKENNNTEKAIELAGKAILYRENKLLNLKDANKTKYIEKKFMEDIRFVLSLYYKEKSMPEMINFYKKFKKSITLAKDKAPTIYLTIESYLANAYADSKQYDKAINHLEKIIITYSQHNSKISKSWIAGQYLSLSWYQIVVEKYHEAINNSKRGISLDKNQKMSLETNLAHAYLLSGDFEKAKFIYMKNVKKRFKDGRLWEDVILKDFEALKKEGVNSDDFKKIEKLLYGENPMVIKFKDNKIYFYYKKSNNLCFSSNTLPSWETIQKKCPKPKDLRL